MRCNLRVATVSPLIRILCRTSLACSGRSTKLIHGGIRYLEAAFMKADTEMYEMVQVRHV